jgi:hypothetical protein
MLLRKKQGTFPQQRRNQNDRIDAFINAPLLYDIPLHPHGAFRRVLPAVAVTSSITATDQGGAFKGRPFLRFCASTHAAGIFWDAVISLLPQILIDLDL